MPHGLMSHNGNTSVLCQHFSASPSGKAEGAEMLHAVFHQLQRLQQALSCSAILWDLPVAPLCPVSIPTHYFREISSILLHLLLQTKASLEKHRQPRLYSG